MAETPNYYDLLEVERNADSKTIHRVYRLLALRYHPDNPNTGDVERFLLLTEAFRVLGDDANRREYDRQFEEIATKDACAEPAPLPIFMSPEFTEGLESEAKLRLGLLSLLYVKRRANPNSSSCSVLELENMMAIPREHMQFALWYLKQKKYALQDDRSSYYITSEGVDHVEEQLQRDNIVEKILKTTQNNSLMRRNGATPVPAG